MCISYQDVQADLAPFISHQKPFLLHFLSPMMLPLILWDHAPKRVQNTNAQPAFFFIEPSNGIVH